LLNTEANNEAEDGTLVAVHIHGWKNNADRERREGDFARFREIIKHDAVVNSEDRAFSTDRIAGIYLGWMGDTSNVPIQEQLTFWDRRRAAGRIASIQMKETLLRIMEATSEHHGLTSVIAALDAMQVLRRVDLPMLGPISRQREADAAQLAQQILHTSVLPMDAIGNGGQDLSGIQTGHRLPV
jgi:dihydrodipicolinate synthase/N-acetylneuraminate lyase